MGIYQYPDKDDLLTCQLINNEYDGVYWGNSETRVLNLALDKIRETGIPKEEIKFLDVGCGMGRLFSVFGSVVGKITALEPDKERFEAALQEGARVSKEYLIPIDVFNGDLSALENSELNAKTDDEKYSAVLSSHVLQHIPGKTAEELIAKVVDKLEDDGLLILTTTYTDKGENKFFREEWVDNRRISTLISEDEFEEVFNEEGVLPVRIWAEKNVLALAEKYGLVNVEALAYHFRGHHKAEEDIKANAEGKKEDARDGFYIFQKRK